MEIDALFRKLLEFLVAQEGSDLYLAVGSAPAAKIHGELITVPGFPVFQKTEVKSIAQTIMTAEQLNQFVNNPETNMAISISGVGRFRANIFRQRGEMSMVVRHIKTLIPSMDDLKLPALMKDMVLEKKGLILLVGATGSGKSTTLASMINHRNKNSSGHILTIEDPIEFLYKNERSLISQREIGIDTESYHEAITNVLRQAPDVVVIGEIRDKQTMAAALEIAQTGHLVMCSLHATNTYNAIERIINFFPSDQHPEIMSNLSINFKGIFAQRLIPNVHGSRTLAIEVLLASSLMKELIQRGNISNIREMMERSQVIGMQTFDMDLLALVQANEISYEEALRNADQPNNLKFQLLSNKNIQEKMQETHDHSSSDHSNLRLEKDDMMHFEA